MTGYFRQSSYGDGETILAGHTNNEYDRLVEVFNSTNGHSHDGSAGQGAPIRTLADTNNDTRIHVEFIGGEDKIRMFINGVERFVLDATNFTLKNATDDVVDITDSSAAFNIDGDFEINIGETHRVVFDQSEGSLRVSQIVAEVEETIFIVDANGMVFLGPDSTQFSVAEDFLLFQAENAVLNTGNVMTVQTSGVNFRFGENFEKIISINEFGIFIDGVPLGEILIIDSALTLTVGPAGDHTTLNGALTFISKRYPTYTNPMTKITLELLDDFVMAEQVIADAIDLSNIVITKQNATGFTNITRSALTQTVDIVSDINTGLTVQRPVFAAINGGKLPTLHNLRFDFTPTTSIDTQGFPIVLSKGSGSYANLTGNWSLANTGALAHAHLGGTVSINGTSSSSNNWLTVGAPSQYFTLLRVSNGGHLNVSTVRLVGDVTTDSNNLIYNAFGNAAFFDLFADAKTSWGCVNIGGEIFFFDSAIERSVGSTRPSLSGTRGSRISADESHFVRTGSGEATSDILIATGSVVTLSSSSTGGSTVTANAISPAGIFFK